MVDDGSAELGTETEPVVWVEPDGAPPDVSDASEGNLTVRAQMSVGALGNVSDAFNLLMESLEGLVGEVRRFLEEVERS